MAKVPQRMVRLQLSGRKLTDLDVFTKSDPFLVISRLSPSSQVRRSETVNNELNPDWRVLYMSMEELCNNDPNMQLLLEVFDDDNPSFELIGSAETSLAQLQAFSSSGTLIELAHKGKHQGDLVVQQCQVDPPSFQEMVGTYPDGRYTESVDYKSTNTAAALNPSQSSVYPTLPTLYPSQASVYPTHPTPGGFNLPYPNQPSNLPYPAQPGHLPYPPQPSNLPYPPQPGQLPYPAQQTTGMPLPYSRPQGPWNM